MSLRGWLRGLVLAAWVVGCSRRHGLPSAMEGQRQILDVALARRAPARLHGKLAVKARSELLGLAGSTGGAVFLDRPGRGHLAVFGPLGGPVVTAQTEGTGLAVALLRDRRHLVESDAGALVAKATGDRLTLDQLLGLLEGELPFAEADVADARLLEGGDLELVLRPVRGVITTVVLDDLGAVPRRVTLSARGDRVLFAAEYAPFEPMGDGGPLLPTVVTLTVPPLELVLELKVRGWDVPEVMPDVFGLQAPDGFTTEPLANLLPAPSP